MFCTDALEMPSSPEISRWERWLPDLSSWDKIKFSTAKTFFSVKTLFGRPLPTFLVMEPLLLTFFTRRNTVDRGQSLLWNSRIILDPFQPSLTQASINILSFLVRAILTNGEYLNELIDLRLFFSLPVKVLYFQNMPFVSRFFISKTCMLSMSCLTKSK